MSVTIMVVVINGLLFLAMMLNVMLKSMKWRGDINRALFLDKYQQTRRRTVKRSLRREEVK